MHNVQIPVSATTAPLAEVVPEKTNGIDANTPSPDLWAQSQAVLLSRVIDLANIMEAFPRTRLDANFDAWKALMSCRAPVELVGLQRQYVENAMTQYRDYAENLSNQIQQCYRAMLPGNVHSEVV